MNGWMIKSPKGEYLLSTYSPTKEKCLDTFYQQISSDKRTDEPFTWWRDKEVERFSVQQVVIKDVNYTTGV
jgi:hypothetical protein